MNRCATRLYACSTTRRAWWIALGGELREGGALVDAAVRGRRRVREPAREGAHGVDLEVLRVLVEEAAEPAEPLDVEPVREAAARLRRVEVELERVGHQRDLLHPEGAVAEEAVLDLVERHRRDLKVPEALRGLDEVRDRQLVHPRLGRLEEAEPRPGYCILQFLLK